MIFTVILGNHFFIDHTHRSSKTWASEAQFSGKTKDMSPSPFLLWQLAAGMCNCESKAGGHTDDEEVRSLWERHYLCTSPREQLEQCAHRIPDQISSCAPSEED